MRKTAACIIGCWALGVFVLGFVPVTPIESKQAFGRFCFSYGGALVVYFARDRFEQNAVMWLAFAMGALIVALLSIAV
jgi:hypothetical protein